LVLDGTDCVYVSFDIDCKNKVMSLLHNDREQLSGSTEPLPLIN